MSQCNCAAVVLDNGYCSECGRQIIAGAGMPDPGCPAAATDHPDADRIALEEGGRS